MWQRWTEYPLSNLQSISSWVPYTILLIGLFLWLIGAKFGRSILTLAMVFCGAMIGKYAPQMVGWSVNSMGSTITGALLMGTLGFLFYRLVVAIGLGAILGLWITTIIIIAANLWVALPPDATVANLIDQVDALLKSLSQSQQFFGVVAGPILGFIGALMMPRLGMSFFFSLLGLTAGLVAARLLAYRDPALWEKLPPSQTMQAGIIAGLVLLGTLIQYWLIRKSGVPAGVSAAGDDDDDTDEQDDEG